MIFAYEACFSNRFQLKLAPLDSIVSARNRSGSVPLALALFFNQCLNKFFPFIDFFVYKPRYT